MQLLLLWFNSIFAFFGGDSLHHVFIAWLDMTEMLFCFDGVTCYLFCLWSTANRSAALLCYHIICFSHQGSQGVFFAYQVPTFILAKQLKLLTNTSVWCYICSLSGMWLSHNDTSFPPASPSILNFHSGWLLVSESVSCCISVFSSFGKSSASKNG